MLRLIIVISTGCETLIRCSELDVIICVSSGADSTHASNFTIKTDKKTNNGGNDYIEVKLMTFLDIIILFLLI